ncbi:DUF3134 domain-containing protein [Lyngbya sp. CCY1209]|uniref:DUF3134 domain-containing protein n=1 Tax=Lyngbya sp. CCY1209 TaxID=2886103 RepID=UPI002D76AABD|nr:DUF3134 domain-containing protein [Lyngbya sp. CCY1209]
MPNPSLQEETSIPEKADESQSKEVFNPSLRETPVHEPADVIPSKQQESLLDWLKRTGRLIARDTLEPVEGYRPEEEEISELIVDDTSDDYGDNDEEMEE